MFADPEQNIAHLSFRPNMVVADFGAGSGVYSLALAKKVGPEGGKVFAIDVQKELLERIKTEAENKSISNLSIIWADIEDLGGTKMADDSVDLAVVSNVLFQLDTKEGLISEVKRVLKPGGQLLVIDWTDAFGGMGPHPGSVITEADAKALFEKSGFVVRDSFDAGAHHYGLVLLKQ